MTTEGPKILLIEDEREIRRFLRVSLGGQGYRLGIAMTFFADRLIAGTVLVRPIEAKAGCGWCGRME
jgi:hypothetical protein